MYVNRTKKNPYTKQTVFDGLSIVFGLAVIGVGIFTFLNPEEHAYLFPVIFLLAAAFQCTLALPRLSGSYGRKSGRRKAAGIGLCIAAGILVMLSVISAICLWR